MTDRTNHPFQHCVDLAQPRLGTTVVYATDEFFAAKERVIDPADPVFVPDRYDDHGKWMDGWESRRKRAPGHDYCIIRLGVPGVIEGFDVASVQVKAERVEVSGPVSILGKTEDDAGFSLSLPVPMD